jgi:PAS domain-containing protein
MMLIGSLAALDRLAPGLVVLASAPGAFAGSIMVVGFVIAACALTLAACAWVISETSRPGDSREITTPSDQARARAELALCETLLREADTAIVVWDGDSLERLSFSKGGELLDASLSGPDGATLAAAVDALRKDGSAFELCARSAGTALTVRGRPVGRHAAVFLRTESPKPGIDHQAILEALPIPVWLRDENLRLRWANEAFVNATGASSLEQASTLGGPLDRAERDLALAARDAAKPVTAKRYAVVQGERRALSLSSHPLPEGSIVGAAIDLTSAAEERARLHPDTDGHVHALNQLPFAIAIFGPDRRLMFSNREYVRLWSLEKDWLETQPTEGEILDRLRVLRLLPEQRDFAAWKRDRLKIFDARRDFEELWHLPNGRALRVAARPRPSGGLLYMFEDVSEQLRLEASHNALVKVQRATLDTLQEGVAVFGTDGRLRLHNAAFARLWKFADGELDDSPHLNAIAEACSTRFGGQPTWKIVTSYVTSLAPEFLPRPLDIERSDGKALSLCLARLPDGSTLVTVTDITDQVLLAQALREGTGPFATSDSASVKPSGRPPKRRAS